MACDLDFRGGTAIKVSKRYTWSANGDASLDKPDFITPLLSKGTGAPPYLSHFGAFGTVAVTADANHDLDTDMILPVFFARFRVADPQERIAVVGGTLAGAIEKEMPGWAFSDTPVVQRGTSATINFWVPFPVGLGLVPGDLQDQFDLWWSLRDLLDGEVKVTFGAAACGNSGFPATITAGTMQYYGVMVERTATPGPGATGAIRTLRYMLKDHPTTSTSADTMPLTESAMIRWAGLYVGTVALLGGDSPQGFTAGRTYTSSVGRYDSVPDRALALIDAADDRPVMDKAYWPGSIQPLLRAPASDVTDHVMASSFDWVADAPPVTVTNNVPLTVVAWFGKRVNEGEGCGVSMTVQAPSGATISANTLRKIAPAWGVAIADALPAFPTSSPPAPQTVRVNTAPVNPLLSVS